MKVAIASDHAGYPGKEAIKRALDRLGIAYLDLGTHSEEAVDYPDYAERVGEAVRRGEAARGILVCGSGIGMAIAANKVPGVRAALAWSEETARLARQHNDANILAVGARTTPAETMIEIVSAFLQADFDGGRHAQRLEKIAQLEKKGQNHE
jgi:ribose 5-phosphate isomerase B